MVTIRPALKEEILRDLDNTPFGKDLFKIEIQKDDYLLHLSYIPKKGFSFTLKELKEKRANRFNFITIEAPGQWMLEPEEFELENFGQARSRISSWARRIEDDYRASLPGFNDLEDFRSQIITEFEKTFKGEGIHFSKEEKENVESSLETIQEKIEKLYKEKDASKHQINIMKQQISKLKESVDILDKRTWVLAAANRVINIFKEVKSAVGEVKTITKDFNNLLPSSTENNESSPDQDDSTSE